MTGRRTTLAVILAIACAGFYHSGIDLSAIAKGFGVDQVAEALESEAIQHFMVEVGGEVRTSGSNPNGNPWRIAIEIPDPSQRGAP